MRFDFTRRSFGCGEGSAYCIYDGKLGERVIRANSQWSSGKTEMAKKRDHTGRGFTRSQQLGALLIVFLLIGLLIYRVMS
jgi:hypothetical protein